MRAVILFFCLMAAVRLDAQQKIFTEDELVSVIMKFHPVARQADIDVKIARAEILASRGAFDPELTAEAARKEFGGTTYYDQRIGDLRIPTWYGIDLFAGVENITGSRVNPEETSGSITYLGFSIQPLRSLLIDKRRAALLQAKYFHQLSQVQQRIVLNDLLYEAVVSYWDWWENYYVHEIMKAALATAEKRFTLVKAAVRLGDRAAIDTIEAYTQVQSFQIKLSEAYLEMVKSNLQLSTYLWLENAQQVELPLDIVPQEYGQQTSFTLADVLNQVTAHPELLQYQFKLKGLQIDKRLALQSLLPEVKLKYNQTGYDLSKTVSNAWFDNNYKFGVSFAMPLRLSQARGDYRKAKLKIESTILDQANKQVQIYTKAKQRFTEWQQSENQLSIQYGLLGNTIALQRGEEMRFMNGESSLFLVNSREQKTIEAEQKMIELRAKVRKGVAGVRWAIGGGN